MASADPPDAAAYHSIVAPAGGVAVSNTVPVPHVCPFVNVGFAGTAFTVAVTASRVAARHPVAVVTTCA